MDARLNAGAIEVRKGSKLHEMLERMSGSGSRKAPPGLEDMLAEALGEALRGGGEDTADGDQELFTTAQTVEVLRAFQGRMAEGSRGYAVGDLVTPRADSMFRDAGQPHIVLATIAAPAPNFTGSENSGSPKFGGLHDMRVGTLKEGVVLCYWVEAAYFEPWVAPASEGAEDPMAAQVRAEGAGA